MNDNPYEPPRGQAVTGSRWRRLALAIPVTSVFMCVLVVSLIYVKPETERLAPIIDDFRDHVIPPANFTARVVNVVGNGTIRVLDADHQFYRLRLHGIDCPAEDQPFGGDVTAFLNGSITRKDVDIRVLGTDWYGRATAEVFIAGQLVNSATLEAGLAWYSATYAPDRDDFAAAEQKARESKRGLWGSSHEAIAPWEWRKLSKKERDEYR